MYSEDLDECPDCEEAGAVSVVRRVGVEVGTSFAVESFRDPATPGLVHRHDDVNEYCYTYRCSLGHVTQHQYTGKSCCCGWLPTEQQKAVDAAQLEDEYGIVTTDTFGSWE